MAVVSAENTGFVKINSLKANFLKANSPTDQVTELLRCFCFFTLKKNACCLFIYWLCARLVGS